MNDWCSCNLLKEAQEKAAKWDAIVRCGECKHMHTVRHWLGMTEEDAPSAARKSNEQLRTIEQLRITAATAAHV